MRKKMLKPATERHIEIDCSAENKEVFDLFILFSLDVVFVFRLLASMEEHNTEMLCNWRVSEVFGRTPSKVSSCVEYDDGERGQHENANFQFLRFFLPFIPLWMKASTPFGVDTVDLSIEMVNVAQLKCGKKQRTRRGKMVEWNWILEMLLEKIWKCYWLFRDASQQWSTVRPPCLFNLNFPFSQVLSFYKSSWRKKIFIFSLPTPTLTRRHIRCASLRK